MIEEICPVCGMNMATEFMQDGKRIATDFMICMYCGYNDTEPKDIKPEQQENSEQNDTTERP